MKLKLTPEQKDQLERWEAEKQQHEASRNANPSLADQTIGKLLTGIDALIEQRKQQTTPNQKEDDGR